MFLKGTYALSWRGFQEDDRMANILIKLSLIESLDDLKRDVHYSDSLTVALIFATVLLHISLVRRKAI